MMIMKMNQRILLDIKVKQSEKLLEILTKKKMKKELPHRLRKGQTKRKMVEKQIIKKIKM